MMRAIFFAILMLPFLAWSQTQDEDLRSEQLYVQSQDYRANQDSYRSLGLNGAIEQGLRKNHDQQLRAYSNEELDLIWRDKFEDFWFPKLSLSLTNTEHRIGKIWDGNRNGTSAGAAHSSGQLSLGFDNYTIFNWGKDYLTYLNTQETFQRSKAQNEEQRRELRHQIITKYFEVVMAQEVEKIYRSQLRNASYVYRLNREKVGLSKIPRLQYYQSRTEYLRAQGEYLEWKNTTAQIDEQMATLIDDPEGTRYLIEDLLRFEPMKIELSEAIETARLHNPDILNARANVNNSARNFERLKRENLPLPTISMNLGAYKYTFGEGKNSDHYETSSGSSDVELVASLQATWSLTGTGGLFNQRSRRTGYVEHLKAIKSQQKNIRQTYSTLKQLMNNIKYYENHYKVLEARTPSMQKRFDLSLDQYIERKISYNDFHLALVEYTETLTLMQKVKYLHLSSKVALATSIGVEEIPGHDFERLIVKKFQDHSSDREDEKKEKSR